jgi:hypothetical protein
MAPFQSALPPQIVIFFVGFFFFFDAPYNEECTRPGLALENQFAIWRTYYIGFLKTVTGVRTF